MEETRKPDKKTDKEEGGERGTAKTKRVGKFKKWFLASSAATLLAIAGPQCTSTTEDVYYPIPGDTQENTDAGQDTDADTDMDGGPDLDADTDTDHDAGPDLDADTDADTDMDGGPDLDADTDADTDSGTDLDGGPDLDADTDADTDSGLDGGPDLDADTDADTDSGPDAGAVCSGSGVGAIYGHLLYTGYDVNVGGYVITNNGAVTGGIEVDIDCGSDSASIATSLFLPSGATNEVVYDVPADGLRLRLNNISSNSAVSNISIVVEVL